MITTFLDLADLGIKFLIPGIVWALLIVGLLQLIRESIPRPRVPSQAPRVAPQGRSQ